MTKVGAPPAGDAVLFRSSAGLLWSTLKKRGDFEIDQRFKRNLPLILLASLAMAGMLHAALFVLEPYIDRKSVV